MKLIVGLGNKGNEYNNTRHNVGFMVVDNYVNKNNLTYKSKLDGLYAETVINGEKVIFLKPQNYINLSGDVINKYIKYFKIKTNEYKRIKIGISKNNIDKIDYVLGKFNSLELSKINKVIDITYNIIEDFVSLSFENLMNKYNGYK